MNERPASTESPCQMIYWGMTDWERLRQRPQHLASELSRQLLIYYVRPVPGSGLARRHGQPVPLVVERVDECLTVLRPRIASPGRLAPIARLNERRVAAMVRAHLDPALPVVLWLSHPDQIGHIGRYGERLVVFDLMDDHAAFKMGGARAAMAAAELTLIRRADLVFTSGQALQERAVAAGARALLVPNGVEFDRFSAAATWALPEPADVQRLPRPRLLYYGTLGPWFDTDLLASIARTRPDWSIVLIGLQAGADLASIARLANVHLLGQRRYEALPAYLQHADICLLPFVLNDLTRAVDPVKVYEYLAAGKPVVATPLPELDKCGDLIDRVTTVTAAIAAIERHLSSPEGAAPRQARLDFAAAHTWQARAATIAEALEAALRERLARP